MVIIKINNIDISEFNCRLMSRNITPSSIKVDSFWGEEYLTPYVNPNVTPTFQKIVLVLDLNCTSNDEVEKMKSKIINTIKISEITFSDIRDITYISFIDSSSATYIMSGNQEITINLSCYALGNEITETITDNTVINNNGDYLVPCNLEITPVADLIDLTITGLSDDPIIIKNLEGSKTVFLNGEKGTILVDGKNKFDDTNLWEFPHLKVGENKINLSNPNCSIQLKYRARFL